MSRPGLLTIDPGVDRRIVVIGNSAAGKTTLARQFADQLACPHVELDALYWGPGWKPVAAGEFRARVAGAVAGNDRISDGNYAPVRDLIWPRATTFVWLNLPLRVVLVRGIRRSLRRAWTGEPLFAGNCETVRKALAWGGVPAWIVRMHGRRRREFRKLLAAEHHQGKRVFELNAAAISLEPIG